ncbi:MAG: HepT-like ribonuclease domain-containing protein [Acidimicrobiia bacterium]
MAHDAVLRNLAVIGEAVRGLSPEIRESIPDVPWAAVAGLRNIVVREYAHHGKEPNRLAIAHRQTAVRRHFTGGRLPCPFATPLLLSGSRILRLPSRRCESLRPTTSSSRQKVGRPPESSRP